MTTKSAKRPIASFMLVSAGAAFTLLAADVDAQEFQYTGDDGPAHWSELNPAWEACAGAEDSARQSPIDIGRADFDSRLTRLNLRTFPTTIDMFNNGHTIEQHYEETGSSISFDGVEYELRQFHFHTLSEHTVRSQHEDVMKMHAVRNEHDVMEMHAVFSSGGLNLVVGVLFEIGFYVNPFIQKLIDAGLPATSTDTTETDDLINVADALTDTSAYYTYDGSLTTPPCSETVTWVTIAELHE